MAGGIAKGQGVASQAPSVKARFIAAPALVIAALVADLHEWERRVYTTYWDALGRVYTVCAGVTGDGVIPGKTYTKAECDYLEGRYIGRMYARMGKCAPKAEMEFHEIKAWGHFSYNIGESAFCRSTAAKLLNEGQNKLACKQIPKWTYVKGKNCRIAANKCGGISRRRDWEFATCEGRI